jgi:hypothetical protein
MGTGRPTRPSTAATLIGRPWTGAGRRAGTAGWAWWSRAPHRPRARWSRARHEPLVRRWHPGFGHRGRPYSRSVSSSHKGERHRGRSCSSDRTDGAAAPAPRVRSLDATIRGPGGGSRYFRVMARLCARPGCNAPAAATFNFDGLNRIVWLNAFTDASAYSAGDLCARHAERLRPPRNWELRDCRPSATTGPLGATAPSRHCAPVPEPRRDRVRARPVGVEQPAASVPLVAPERDPAQTHVASATTPLLARAFRGAGGD